ncbi:MAG: ribonuclease J [Bacilli bacterium]|jgi:ribonuclease J
MHNFSRSETAVFALGGLGEVGKNLYCVEDDTTIIIIDSGVMFPEENLPGIDYVIPDFSYLVSNQYKIKALLITHGHEDHIGSIPFLLQKVNIPIIYAPRLAAALIKNKLEEFHIRQKVNIEEIDGDSSLTIDDMRIDFFSVTHSIPDSLGLAINTPNGRIVHTGDFKIDLTPIGQHMDLHKIAAIGKAGVTLLLSDSTNAEVPGLSLSESKVVEQINDVFKNTRGRLLVATFASNIHRIQQIVEAAVRFKRKIAIVGRSMDKTVSIGRKYGYIRCPDSQIIAMNNVNLYRPEQLLILCTGSQGEPLAALSRISNGTHKYLKIMPGDTVVFSSSPIPGNALSINRVVNKLYRQGANVLTNSILNNIHASGHANQEELKCMLALLEPKYFMPIHGEYRMLKIHAEIAQSLGIPKENIFVLANGDTIIIRRGEVRLGQRVAAEDIYVDGKDSSGLSTAIIRDRKILSSDGVLICLITMDSRTNQLIIPPKIVSRGFIKIDETGELVKSASQHVEDSLQELFAGRVTFANIKNTIRNSLASFIYEKTNRNPMIVPVIMNKLTEEDEVLNHVIKDVRKRRKTMAKVESKLSEK